MPLEAMGNKTVEGIAVRAIHVIWILAIHVGMTAYFNSMVSPAPPPFLEFLHKLVPNALAMPGQIIRHVRVAPVVGFVLGQKLDDQRRRLRPGRV